jgi:tetratricopeptide (TPR) repeat protein
MILRIGGFIFFSLQEYRNILSIRQKGTFRIMCLGESTTVVGDEDSYPSQLEKILNERNTGVRFSVINKGVVGTDTTAILSSLEGNLDKYAPDMVIAMMGINDNDVFPQYIIAYKGIKIFKNIRIFKLAKLIHLHLRAKVKAIGFGVSGQNLEEFLYPGSSVTGVNGPEFTHDELQLIKLQLIRKIEFNPVDENAYLDLGFIYLRQGKYVPAEDLIRKAIELNPNNHGAYIYLGSLYERQGKCPNLVGQLYKKAMELNSNSDIPHIILGRSYRHRREFIRAEEFLKKAIGINPDELSYFVLGCIYLEQGSYPKAHDIFLKALEVNPHSDLAYGALGLLYDEMGKYEYADEYYRKANTLRSKYFNSVTIRNYRKLKEALDKRGIKLVCVQYPMRSLQPLKNIFTEQEGIIFVDNENVFRQAIRKTRYKDYFKDVFAGDFGHCTPKGNRILAEHIANAVLRFIK